MPSNACILGCVAGWAPVSERSQCLPFTLAALGAGLCSESPFLLSVHVGLDDPQVCADPGVPENGFRTPSGGLFFESSVARFHCQDGFKLKGSLKRLCVKFFNGTLGWVPSDKPICVEEGKCFNPLPGPLPTETLHVVRSCCVAAWVRGCVGQSAQCPGLLPLSRGQTCTENHACVLRDGGGKFIPALEVIIFLLYLNYRSIYHCFCQCGRETQMTLGLFIIELPTPHSFPC